TLTERLVAELEQEAQTTRRVLERVPQDKLTWKPHAKSMSMGQLALHVAVVPGRIAELVSEPVRELPNVPRPEAKSTEELLSSLAGSIEFVTNKVRQFGEEGLEVMLHLTRNGQTILQMPRYNMIRVVMLNRSE